MYNLEIIRAKIHTAFGVSFDEIADMLGDNRNAMHRKLSYACPNMYIGACSTCANVTVHCPCRYVEIRLTPDSDHIRALLTERALTCAHLDEYSRTLGLDPRSWFDSQYTGGYTGPVCAPAIARRTRKRLQEQYPEMSVSEMVALYAKENGISQGAAKDHLYHGLVDVVAFANEIEQAGVSFVEVLVPDGYDDN